MHSTRRPRLRPCTTALTFALVLAACGGGDSAPTMPPPPTPEALRSVSLAPTADTLAVGSSGSLTPTPDRAGGAVNVTYSYASSTPTVASVSGAGVVTAVAVGTATITVTAVGSGTGFTTSTRTASATITVRPQPPALTAFTVSPDSAVLAPGNAITITATPTNATGAAVAISYVSRDPAIASVSSTGVVTALTAGVTIVDVSAVGTGSGLQTATLADSLLIRVIPPPAITAFSVALDSLDVVAFRDSSIAVHIASPTGAPTATVSVSSSSSAIVTAVVQDAALIVTGVSEGFATLTLTASAPASATYAATTLQRTVAVSVMPAPAALLAVTLSPAADTLQTGGMLTLDVATAVAVPSATLSREFRSSATSIATVNDNGVVTAVAVGTASISVAVTASAQGFTSRTLSDTMQLVVVAAPALGVGFGDEQFAPPQGGEFLMGSNNHEDDEKPVRLITLSPTRMQRTEVTQGQWQQVMQGTGLENPSSDQSCGPTCPVESVSWADVQQFVTRLNAQQPGKGYRLPTEAEWEYWARAGTTTDYGGNGVLDDMGWWSGNSGGRKRPVAQKLPNTWGVYDMHGNVWEWTVDWYGAYPAGPAQNPRGPFTGEFHPRRGGAFNSTTNSPRSSNRGFGVSADVDRGFRLIIPMQTSGG